MHLNVFNEVSAAEAAEVLRPCIDVERWINDLVSARPFSSFADLEESATRSAAPFSPDEIAAALAHHPRIGEQAGGNSQEAALSRGEQAALDLNAGIVERLAAANRAYEQRFDRVFLIRAAGRSSEEILAECQRRLQNTDEAELAEVADQLRQIALLRLQDAVKN
ncbi:2-oxo-4-hydroxy-4-carboxy-5-ureidoimidazoline decarboxylase [Glutamicibacter protophormiae]|uniref:2-oxo-4-hydroxy-4-carboxy-5-ureidoimidazoline decarboxylase n=1 Tax=Glutamicibacter protophormiae TaxID=37930 RepID=A0ABS4XQ72_GLUPR|nr:2-oxo-4-hydroxy-4-carboxy-5-ureidoimidazoline decarboxylase [Glutamicibacter protophormiae]MBP2397873.1 2-oxo-4-hydroxy-4-carboxy-5-ureidoimidazoline decarboxylase [Glutamicibacter protophormiae]GGL85946.1 OHCU decarboxylase [Glutamicibacter protophormiae]